MAHFPVGADPCVCPKRADTQVRPYNELLRWANLYESRPRWGKGQSVQWGGRPRPPTAMTARDGRPINTSVVGRVSQRHAWS